MACRSFADLFLFMTQGLFLHLGTGLHFLEKFQGIPTKGARGVASFHIESTLFLAIANHHGDKHKYKTTSDVYKLEGGRFLHYQTLYTKGASSVKHFAIHGNSYLVVANYYDGSSRRVNSFIYKWNGKLFTVFQEIPTFGARDVIFFSVGGNFFLAFANYHDDSSYSTSSFVFQWKSGTYNREILISTQEKSKGLSMRNWIVTPGFFSWWHYQRKS